MDAIYRLFWFISLAFSKCSGIVGVAEDCYFASLLDCAECGFDPVMKQDSDGNPILRYFGQGRNGNHRSSDGHPLFVRSQIEAMLARGAVEECVEQELIVLSPLGVAIPQSAIHQAQLLTGVHITDELSLEAAKAIAAEKELDLPLKPRLILDPTGSGVNDLLEKRPFSFVGPENVAELMTPGCHFSSCDGSRYYYHFPMSQSFRRYMGFTYEGKFYRHMSLPFGISSAPCLVSGMSAEFIAIMKARGAKKTICMIDDFMTIGENLAEAQESQAIMEDTLVESGIVLEPSKRINPTTQIVFTGIKYDSEDMTTSVNPPSAGRCAATLEIILATLESVGQLTSTVTHHTCGKLTDYSKVCQRGKSKIHAAWRYLTHGENLWPSVRAKMIEDLKWWRNRLTFWSQGGVGGCYPVVNGSTLLNNRGSVRFLVSDYSGTDGFGGVSGDLVDTNPRFFSVQHPDSRVKESSFVGELKVLRHELQRELDEFMSSHPSGSASPPPPSHRIPLGAHHPPPPCVSFKYG